MAAEPVPADAFHLERRDTDATLLLSGELSYTSVTQALALTAGWPAQVVGKGAGILRVDLSGVQHCDSAGVALLLQWLRKARLAGREIRFQNLPEQMRSLVHFFDLEDILHT